MLFFFLLKYIAFPSKTDAIFNKIENKQNEINVEASGSLGLHYGGHCHRTNPNETLYENMKMDWCSNIAQDTLTKPWIMYSLAHKAMSLTGYSVRVGCCYYACCCIDDETPIDGRCCCDLFSFSLHGSNDNKTWEMIHQVHKNYDLDFCEFKTFEFPKTPNFKYIKLVLDEPRPGCENCMAINQIEFYGETSNHVFPFEDDHEEDESVSIIGKINKHNEE